MTISVRPVHLHADHEELLDLLQMNLPELTHAKRFQWLYCANPDGPAWAWFACQGTTGKAVGVASLFPRTMWVDGQPRLCGQVGDFAIAPGHRSLGPALLLQRATFQPVDEGKLAFCYDCPPHDAGMSTFRRLGIAPNCTIERYALLLRIDRQITSRLGARWGCLASPGNILLRFFRRPRLLPPGLEISEHIGLFGEEFSKLDALTARSDIIRGRRSAAHLNWRYRADPSHTYRVLTARRKGELLAFLVYRIGRESLTIVDCFGEGCRGVGVALLEATLHAVGSSHQNIEAYLSQDHEWVASLRQARFRRRSAAARVVAYSTSASDMSNFLRRKPKWAFSQAELLV